MHGAYGGHAVTMPAPQTVIDRYLRVDVVSGVVAIAGASAVAIGTTARRHQGGTSQNPPPLGATDFIEVILETAPEPVFMVADGAISAFADVFAAADGKVSGSGTAREGMALEAATADGDVIRVARTTNSGS